MKVDDKTEKGTLETRSEVCMMSTDHETEAATNHLTRCTSPLAMFRDQAWCIALVAVVAFAFFVRGSMLFRGAVPAGMDAGYYAVQARELLERGALRWSDVPLTFLCDAVLAKCTMLMFGWDIDTATLWASRVVDIVAEPLAAIPLFMAAWIFGRGTRSAIPSVVAVGLALTISPPLLRMVGDFEKQSMAYVFMASTWICTWTAMRAIDRRRSLHWWLAAIVMLVLTALTHAGTCAATALGCVLMLVVWAVRCGISLKQAMRAALLIAVVGGVLFGAVWWIAPGKAEAVIKLPAKLISGESESSGAMGGPGGPGGPDGPRGPGGPRGMGGPEEPRGMRGPGEMRGPGDMHGPGEPGGQRGMRGPPGPPISGAWMGAAWITALAVGIAALTWATRSLRRTNAEECTDARADEALLFGLLFTAACLACPLLSGDQMMRLALMEPVPLACIAAFLLCVPRRRGWQILQTSVAVIAAAVLIVNANASRHGRLMQTVDDVGFAELRSWRADIAPGDQAVVAARHGLEFWAAFAMDTHARWGTLKDADFDRYERLYILEARRGSGGPPGAGGRGPMSVAAIPRESQIVKQSDRFTLWEVPKSARDAFRIDAERIDRPTPSHE